MKRKQSLPSVHGLRLFRGSSPIVEGVFYLECGDLSPLLYYSANKLAHSKDAARPNFLAQVLVNSPVQSIVPTKR